MVARSVGSAGLPLELSSFIGRDAEISHLAPLVLQHRLVTLTGSGGAGKSRLAFEVARGLATEFAGDVRAVELASLADPALVPSAVAEAVGLIESPDAPLLETLAAYFEAREFLLVLDNCEHLIEACAAFVETLLRRCCTDLRILATSREPLGLPGEIAWRVPPLSVPPPLPPGPQVAGPVGPETPPPGPLTVESFDAIRLFTERAQEVDPGFTLNPQNTAAVAAICRRLDGMPLAIELAAARVKVLTPGQIEARLEDALGLLSWGGRGAPSRHRTIRATIEWSYRLLDDLSAAVLQRLAVFNGGCTVEAAAAVCRDVVITPDLMLDTLTQLVDKSLLVPQEAGGEMRYHLLETIRQFASERLAEAGEAGAARERHLGFYLALAERARPEMRSKKLLEWLERLDLEHDNFRSALRFALDKAGDSEAFASQALRLAIALELYWRTRNHFTEGRAWLAQALTAPTSREHPELRGHALTAAASLAWFQAGPDVVRPLIDESIAFWRSRQPENTRALADALRILGMLYWAFGNEGPAQTVLAESLDLYRLAHDELGMADVLWVLGASNIADNPRLTRELIEQALPIYERYGDITGGQPRNWLANLHVQEGNYDAARELFEASLAEAAAQGHKFGMTSALHRLARVALFSGDADEAWRLCIEAEALARDVGVESGNEPLTMGYVMLAKGNDREASSLFLEALDFFRKTSDERGIASCLIGWARVKCSCEEPREAAQLLGASEAVCERAGGGAYWSDGPDRKRCLQAIRARLDAETIAIAQAQGARLTLEEAVALARGAAPAQAPSTSALTSLKAIKAQFGGLTAREREVAACVASDMSNREIAEELVVVERTVEAHIANILSKLEFTSRRQIARWAVEKKLVRARRPEI